MALVAGEFCDAFIALPLPAQTSCTGTPQPDLTTCRPPSYETMVHMAVQIVFEHRQQEGVLVGFWCPAFVGSSLNVPGFHFHFLSADKQRGGHVLQLEMLTGAAAYLQEVWDSAVLQAAHVGCLMHAGAQTTGKWAGGMFWRCCSGQQCNCVRWSGWLYCTLHPAVQILCFCHLPPRLVFYTAALLLFVLVSASLPNCVC